MRRKAASAVSGDRLSAKTKTLFQHLKSAGFSCLAAPNSTALLRSADLLRGSEWVRPWKGEEVIGRFTELAMKGKRVFAFVHMTDVHAPYGVSDNLDFEKQNREIIARYLDFAKKQGLDISGYEKRPFIEFFNRMRALAREKDQSVEWMMPFYLEGVNRFDRIRMRRFWEMLEMTGTLEDTLVVITADHGEGVYERGQTHFDHGGPCAEEQLRIPLIFWTQAEGFRKGMSDVPVSLVDIVPTVLSLLKVKTKTHFDGIDRAGLFYKPSPLKKKRSARPSECYAESWTFQDTQTWVRAQQLLDLLGGKGEPSESDLEIFSDDSTLVDQTVREGNLKLQIAPKGKPQLFDTAADPFETTDLSGKNPAAVKRLAQRLARISRSRAKARRAGATQSTDANAELIQSLKDLGYL